MDEQNQRTDEPELEQPSEDELLFRKKALLERGSSDQLDQLFQPMPSIIWIAWVIAFLLLIALTAWLFWGSVPLLVQGKGIFVNDQGLFSIQSKVSGSVSEILVKPGMLVEKGQLVAIIKDPQERFKYESALMKEKHIRQNLALLKKQIGTEERAEKEALEKQIISSRKTILELENSIIPLESDLKKKEDLAQKGLLSLKDLQDTKQLLTQRRIALETTKGNLENFKVRLEKGYREEEVKAKERDLLQAMQERQLLELTQKLNQVYSTDSGYVTELLVAAGSHVNAGTPLMHLEYYSTDASQHLVYAYIPIEKGKRVREGTSVEIEPSTVNPQEYGAILGTVVGISSFAVSKENIASLLQNASIVDYLIQNGEAAVQITIAPLPDPSAPSGLKWTSGKGPQMKISTGTICSIKIIADRERPLYELLSYF